MKKNHFYQYLLFITALSLSFYGHARLLLDTLVFQVSAKEWVSTQTALLTVDIHATLSNTDIIKTRADIMDSLNKIASGDWQLTQFDRSQDSSGLETLFVQAQIRVQQAALNAIYSQAKTISKPGISYKINGLEFKPSLEEIQKVKANLREKLYILANEEVLRLNKIYTAQNYSIHKLYIIDAEAASQPRALERGQMYMVKMAAAATPASENLSVSNALILNAVVELASNRQKKDSLVKP